MRRFGRSIIPAALLTTAALAVTACSDPTHPDGRTEAFRGVVEWFQTEAQTTPTWPGDQAVIEAPDVVEVGETFQVLVRTLGRSGCWSSLRTDVDVSGLQVDVVPVDQTVEGPDVVCTSALVQLSHDFQVTFDVPGEATIRVDARRVVGPDFTQGEPLTLEKTVTVVAP